MPSSQSSTIKGYGGRPNFQASYGLDMTPSGIAEGNQILNAFAAADAAAAKSSSQQAAPAPQGTQPSAQGSKK